MPVMRVPAPMHTGNFARDSLNLAIAGARNLQIDMFNRQEAAWLASRQQALRRSQFRPVRSAPMPDWLRRRK